MILLFSIRDAGGGRQLWRALFILHLFTMILLPVLTFPGVTQFCVTGARSSVFTQPVVAQDVCRRRDRGSRKGPKGRSVCFEAKS